MVNTEGGCGRRSNAFERVVKTTIQRHFYRTGLVREEISLRSGYRQGVHRTWHKNGALASQESYVNGLLHGICRQWDETGHLLGKHRMVLAAQAFNEAGTTTARIQPSTMSAIDTSMPNWVCG